MECRSCKIAMLLWYWCRDWLRSHICTILHSRYPLDSEISILNSFLHPEMSCIDVFRLRSSTLAICQRVCCETVAFLSRPPLLFTNPRVWISWIIQLSAFYHCVEPCCSKAPSCQALQCRSSLQGMIANLCNQTRRVFPRVWITCDFAVCEDCNLVNKFLSSATQCSSALSNQVSRCSFQLNEVECTRFTHALSQMFCSFC